MPTQKYTLKDGTPISGVTTIISNLGWNKQALLFWANQEGLAGRNHRDTSQKAADAGTIGHYLIECDIKSMKPDLSKFPKDLIDKGETAYLNFLQWKKTVNFNLVHSELSLISEKYKYGATIDCIAWVNDELALVDWKTGNGVYDDHKIQLAAYKRIYEENSKNILAGGIYCIRIDKETAGYDMKYRHDYPNAWQTFLYLLEIHNLKKLVGKE
jgi:hypothetical protein